MALIVTWFIYARPSLRIDEAVKFYNQGNAASRAGEYVTAITEYDTALALRPDLAVQHTTILHWCWPQLERVMRRRQSSSLRRAIALSPRFATAHYNLGCTLYDQGDKTSAFREFRASIAINPNFAPAHNNLGALLDDEGDTQGAEAEFRRALAIDHQLATANANLGLIMENEEIWPEPSLSTGLH